MAKINFNITVIRHAQTTYGEQNQFMGTLDIPCSDKGKSEAIAARLKFSDINYFRVYCSPLKRAVQTTEFLFPGKNFIVEENLIERELGLWAGKTFSAIKKEFPEAFLKSGKIDPYFTPKNGEPIENVIFRVKNFIDLLLDLFTALKYENKATDTYNIAIVTHNGIIRVMRYLMNTIPISDIFSENEKHLAPIKYSFDGKHWKQLTI
ncbi:MAG: Phosphoserine phosphatase 1 [Saprospiraceae bacterium]|nr:Phosphoserine phosphatase 1 [Saprospiraceae bacterium]